MTLDWTPTASRNLRAAYDYVAAESVAAAESLVDRIFSAVEMLKSFPLMGRDGRLKGTRELVISKTQFVVAYRILPKPIEVLAVFHGARKWPEEF